MPRTDLAPRNRTHPAFDRFPRSVDPRHAWMNLCRITKSIGVRSVFQRKTDLTPCRSTFRRQDNPTVTGKLSKVGRCRIAGCPRHGCRGQAPRDGLTASPQSDTAPPSHRQPRAALALALAVAGQRPALPQVQGAALPTPPPLRTKTISLISANRHPFATPVPYCAAACACGRPVLKNARPSLRSIQDDAAMAGSWGSSNRTYQATRAAPLAVAWRQRQSHFKLDRFKLSVPRHRINP